MTDGPHATGRFLADILLVPSDTPTPVPEFLHGDGHVTPEAIRATLDATVRQPLIGERILVHPREDAWIRNPVGPAPTARAADIALGLGAIGPDHPEVRALMRTLGGQSEPESDGGTDAHARREHAPEP